MIRLLFGYRRVLRRQSVGFAIVGRLLRSLFRYHQVLRRAHVHSEVRGLFRLGDQVVLTVDQVCLFGDQLLDVTGRLRLPRVDRLGQIVAERREFGGDFKQRIQQGLAANRLRERRRRGPRRPCAPRRGYAPPR